MEFFKQTAKAVAGFVVGVVGVIVQRLGTGESALPDDLKGWLILAGIGVLGYLGVFVPGNKLTAKQINKAVPELTEHERAGVANATIRGLPPSARANVLRRG